MTKLKNQVSEIQKGLIAAAQEGKDALKTILSDAREAVKARSEKKTVPVRPVKYPPTAK